MKPLITAGVLTAFAMTAIALLPYSGHSAAPQAKPVPVIVELFTSEGCSSCPPADQTLADLAKTQPVSGAVVIPLGYHVDYWNTRSWRDTFSQPTFSQRQDRYRARFHNDEVYTPQMVVGGSAEFVGSDAGRAKQAIADAAERLRGSTVTLSLSPVGADSYTVQARGKAGSVPLNVWVAVTEDGLSSQVRGGENAGRRLPHVAVVRRLLSAGRSRPTAPLSLDTTVRLPVGTGESSAHQHIVAWVQEAETGAIVAAEQIHR